MEENTTTSTVEQTNTAGEQNAAEQAQQPQNRPTFDQMLQNGYQAEFDRRVAKAIYRKAELGMVDLREFPLMTHVNDVLDNGKDAQLPWESFTFDHTK